MPVKKFLPFILIGFILSAYLAVPVLGIAIIGFAAAFWYFTTEMKKAAEAETKAAAVTTVDEMEMILMSKMENNKEIKQGAQMLSRTRMMERSVIR